MSSRKRKWLEKKRRSEKWLETKAKHDNTIMANMRREDTFPTRNLCSCFRVFSFPQSVNSRHGACPIGQPCLFSGNKAEIMNITGYKRTQVRIFTLQCTVKKYERIMNKIPHSFVVHRSKTQYDGYRTDETPHGGQDLAAFHAYLPLDSPALFNLLTITSTPAARKFLHSCT